MFGLIENLRECEILMFGVFLGILKELFIFLIPPLNSVNPISYIYIYIFVYLPPNK